MKKIIDKIKKFYKREKTNLLIMLGGLLLIIIAIIIMDDISLPIFGLGFIVIGIALLRINNKK